MTQQINTTSKLQQEEGGEARPGAGDEHESMGHSPVTACSIQYSHVIHDCFSTINTVRSIFNLDQSAGAAPVEPVLDLCRNSTRAKRPQTCVTERAAACERRAEYVATYQVRSAMVIHRSGPREALKGVASPRCRVSLPLVDPHTDGPRVSSLAVLDVANGQLYACACRVRLVRVSCAARAQASREGIQEGICAPSSV